MKDARRICFFPDTGIERATFNTDPYTFEDCGYGVVAKRVRSDIRLCRMNTFQGIHVHNVSASNHATIAHNRIEAHHTGIGLYHNDAAQFVRVHDNHIQMSAPAALLGNRTGIDVQYTKFADCRLHLYCNHVSMLTSGWGIRLNSARAAAGQGNIHHNDISFDPNPNGLTAGNPAGLLLLNTDNFRLSENDISGSGGAQVAQTVVNQNAPSNGTDQTAIKLFGANYNTLECNRTDQSLIGMGFSLINLNSVVRGNEFGDHSLALAYSSTAVSGVQADAGNKWTGNYAYMGAENLNALSYLLSEYLIDYAIAPFTQPYYPSSYMPSLWFAQSLYTGGTYECQVSNSPCNTEQEIGDTPPDWEWLHSIARDSFVTQDYQEEMRWLSQQGLYGYLAEHDSLRLDTVLQAFYQSRIQANIGLLYDIQRQIREVHILTHQDSLNLVLLDSLRQSYIYVLLHDSSHTDSLVLLIAQTDSSIQSITTNIAAYQHSVLDFVKQQNELLLLTEVYQENERNVNALILEVLGSDSTTLDSSQWALLGSIASQCPLSGGNAVFKARSLYKIYDPYSEYDDNLICLQGGLQMREASQVPGSNMAETHNAGMIIIPNPSTGVLRFVLPAHAGGGTIALCDGLGQTVKLLAVPPGADRLEADCLWLPDGIYVARWVSGAQFEVCKFIIQT